MKTINFSKFYYKKKEQLSTKLIPAASQHKLEHSPPSSAAHELVKLGFVGVVVVVVVAVVGVFVVIVAVAALVAPFASPSPSAVAAAVEAS